MAETATEAMVADMIRDPIKNHTLVFRQEKNTVKPCNGWPTSNLTIFVIPSFFFSSLICNYPVSVNSADKTKLGTPHEVKRLLSKLLSLSRNQQKVLFAQPCRNSLKLKKNVNDKIVYDKIL